MVNGIKYKIEIVFSEDLREKVREKLKELKEIVVGYHQVRDYDFIPRD